MRSVEFQNSAVVIFCHSHRYKLNFHIIITTGHIGMDHTLGDILQFSLHVPV
jgi:hypothetical protein